MYRGGRGLAIIRKKMNNNHGIFTFRIVRKPIGPIISKNLAM